MRRDSFVFNLCTKCLKVTNLGVAAKVDGYKGNPDDARRVHGEAYELGLVEILRDVSRLDGVECAQCYQQEVEGEGRDDPERRRVAGQHHAVQGRKEQCRGGRFQNQHGGRDSHLNSDQRARDEYLRTCSVSPFDRQ